MEEIKNIDEYIGLYPVDVQEKLEALRKFINDNIPKVTEKISWGMPTFVLNGILVQFAAYKKHIGFYPGPSAILLFKNELSAYKGAKGSVQFPLDKPIPYDIIRKIIEMRVEENLCKKK